MAPSRSGGRPSRTRPVRSTRTRVETYHEDTSADDDLDAEETINDNASRRSSVSLRPRTSSGIRRSYREDSSDVNFEDSSDDNGATVPDAHPPMQTSENVPASSPSAPAPTTSSSHDTSHTRPRASNRPSRPSQTKSTKRTNKQAPKRALGQPLKKRARIDVSEKIFLSSGVIPPWASLPYHILFDIFQRASYPLFYGKLVQRSKSTQWLLDVGLLCRQFLEPALAALYYSPPLVPVSKSFDLLDLLSKSQESPQINYAPKVKELHVDVQNVLVYKSGPQLGWFDLCKLIATTPQVHTIRLFHKHDFTVGIPARTINASKWVYPERMFSAIDERGIVLRSWDWNGRFMLDTPALLPFMLEKHQRAAFQRLKHLRLYHVNDFIKEDTPALEFALAVAIRELPLLERLEFFECSLIAEHSLARLPSTLRSLTLINCNRVFPGWFTSYLECSGRELRELILCHNRHLDMGFITHLGEYCPKLERFKMDVSMHDLSSYHDMELHCDHLLTESQIPTWPETLREIELIQLKKLSRTTMESFFMSLVNAAPKLPHLRRLIIKVILNLGWRDRATFRERWIHRLETTFLRRSAPPDPNLRSLRKRTLHPSQPIAGGESARPSSAGSEPPTPSKRQSVRLAQLKDSPSRSPSPSSHGQIRQGMCNVVKIRIDNQRPTETQFNEADFLDDELSGDEDWAGADWEPPDRHAW